MATSHGQGRKALPLAITIATLALLASPATSAAQNERWQFGSTPSFSTGDYGTGTRTDVLYTPVTARRLFKDGDLTFVFPFLCVWGDGSVTLVNGSATGVPVQQQRIDNSAATGRATSDRTGRATSGGNTAASEPARTNRERACGVGDVVVRGRYFVLDERSWMPTVAIRAHVKAPTASSERQLGTGRPDEGFGVEVSRTIGRGMLAMIDGGFTFLGKPAGVVYNDNWWYDIGIGRDFASDAVNLSVFFEEDRAIVPVYPNGRSVLAAVGVKGANGWRLQLSAEFGLSDGAPDRGATFGASRRF